MFQYPKAEKSHDEASGSGSERVLFNLFNL